MLLFFLTLISAKCPYNFQIDNICKYKLQKDKLGMEDDYEIYHGLMSGENLYMYEINPEYVEKIKYVCADQTFSKPKIGKISA